LAPIALFGLFGASKFDFSGTVWIDHSLAFRSQERLFITADRWQAQRRPYFRRLRLPTDPAVFLEPCVQRAEAGMAAVAAAAEGGYAARR
jgi:hypothetical protein